MKKELNTLYNQLKKAGLNSYASKVAAIYKKAGEFEDYMAKEMGHSNEAEPDVSTETEEDLDIGRKPRGRKQEPSSGRKPRARPLEEDIDNLSSGRKPRARPLEEDLDNLSSGRKPRARPLEVGGECEEFANALLPLLGTENDMDKFYPAAVNFFNTVKKLYNHPDLDKIRYARKINVKSKHDLFDDNKIDGYDENGNPIPLRLRKWEEPYEGSKILIYHLKSLINLAAAESYGNILTHTAGLLIRVFNDSEECVKSICSTILDASPKTEQEKEMHMRSLNDYIKIFKNMAPT